MSVYSIFGYVGAAALVLTILRFFIAKPSNLVVCFLQNFVGALFIFSGFVKAVDPLGTGYKMHEYFEAFAGEGMRPFWEWVAGFSEPKAIAMIAIELFIGFMLIIGWQPRFTVTVIWWLTLFFTFLTGYTYLSGYIITHKFIAVSAVVILLFAVIPLLKEDKRFKMLAAALFSLLILLALIKFTNLFFTQPFEEGKMKVTDCGCFGDFIKLKPWETFWKDVFLDVLILVLVLSINSITPVFKKGRGHVIAVITAVASLFFCLYNSYWNEPMIDFRPYAKGNNIVKLRQVEEEAVIEYIFIYKNKSTGELKEFTVAEVGKMNYEQWDYVDRKENIINPGKPAKILGFNIYNEGVDITDTLLHNPGYSLMVISWRLPLTHENAFKELNTIAAGCEKAGVPFYAVVSNDGKVDEFRHRNQTPYPFYTCDETPLKTMMRSNPGLLLLKNGVVVNKWHYMHLPTFDALNETYFKK